MNKNEQRIKELKQELNKIYSLSDVDHTKKAELEEELERCRNQRGKDFTSCRDCVNYQCRPKKFALDCLACMHAYGVHNQRDNEDSELYKFDYFERVKTGGDEE